MTKLEIDLLEELIGVARERMSSRICSDFLIENSQQAIDILNSMESWNVHGGTPENVYTFDSKKKDIYVQDWYLFAYLCSKALAELKASSVNEN